MKDAAHSYQYTFAPNPRWSSLYAPGAEIREYLHGVADKFGALRYIKTSHRLDRAVWDEEKKKWYEMSSGGGSEGRR